MVSNKDHVVSIGSARCEAPAQLGIGSAGASPAQYKQVCRSTKSDLNAHVNTTAQSLWKKKLFEKVAKLILVKT